MKTLLKTEFGSHLYGTNLPGSDRDFKVVFLPSLDDFLLHRELKNKVSQTQKNGKNTEADTDVEHVPVTKFVDDFVHGQTYALELAFCPQANQSAAQWNGHNPFRTFLHELRSTCLTREVTAMVGYCLGQARRYSVKGDRLNEVEMALTAVSEFALHKDPPKLSQLKSHHLLPTGRYLTFTKDATGLEFYKVCEKHFQLTLTAEQLVEHLKTMRAQFGARAKKAADMDGSDWKAIMHACRVVMEAEQLLTDGKLTLPFTGDEREFLLRVRQGQESMDTVQGFLDARVSRVRELQELSTLPTVAEVEHKAERLLLTFLKEELL